MQARLWRRLSQVESKFFECHCEAERERETQSKICFLFMYMLVLGTLYSLAFCHNKHTCINNQNLCVWLVCTITLEHIHFEQHILRHKYSCEFMYTGAYVALRDHVHFLLMIRCLLNDSKTQTWIVQNWLTSPFTSQHLGLICSEISVLLPTSQLACAHKAISPTYQKSGTFVFSDCLLPSPADTRREDWRLCRSQKRSLPSS